MFLSVLLLLWVIYTIHQAYKKKRRAGKIISQYSLWHGERTYREKCGVTQHLLVHQNRSALCPSAHFQAFLLILSEKCIIPFLEEDYYKMADLQGSLWCWNTSARSQKWLFAYCNPEMINIAFWTVIPQLQDCGDGHTDCRILKVVLQK